VVGHAGSITGIVHADMTLTRYNSQGHGALELPKISEAVHAGSDDLAGLSGWVYGSHQ